MSHVEDLHHLDLGRTKDGVGQELSHKTTCASTDLVCSVSVVEAHDGLLGVCDGLDASQRLRKLAVHVVNAAHRVRPGGCGRDDDDADLCL